MAKGGKPKLAAPFDAEAAGNMLAELGQLAADEAMVKARLAKLIDRATARANKRLAVLEASIAETKKALKKFADKNRAALCADGEKTITLNTGELYWKNGDEAVELSEWVEAPVQVIAQLEDRDFLDCIRVVESLDKEAIKKAWPELADSPVIGLRLVQREHFYLRPTGIAEPLKMNTKTIEVIDELDGNPKENPEKD